MKRTAKPRIPNQDLLNALLGQAVQRRPYMSALALVTPGGQLMAAALPPNVEGETLAALAAPVALLGRRIALEQLNADMRQVFVEGDGGYTILRAIGNAAVLLTVATSGANIALVLHDVRQLEVHLSEVLGITSANAKPQWAEAAGAIDKLRQLVTDGKAPGLVEGQIEAVRAKLDSLDLGYFPERVANLRARLNAPTTLSDPDAVDQLETELLQLEQDVMAALDQQMATAAEEEKQRQAAAAKRSARPAKTSEASAQAARSTIEAEALESESHDQPNSSIIRRMLRWLASMIESND
jgi:predicted regulator of Ras-like GTPase activity (Roadblock/LC7/MglB family)